MSEDKKKTRTLTLLILFLPLALFCGCKKSPTVPQIDDASRPVIWLSRFEMAFTASVSGGNPASQILKIKNAGSGTLEYTLEADADWVSLSPAAGTSTGQEVEHTVSVDKNELDSKEENQIAAITILSSQAFNNPQQVRVNLHLSKDSPPRIWVGSRELTFNAREGGTDPPTQNLKIKNEGNGILEYELSANPAWLSINPQTGSTQGALRQHKVRVDITGLSPGSYKGKIQVRSPKASNSPQTVEVTLTIGKEVPPAMGLSTKNLSFGAVRGGSDPAPKTFTVRNTGGGTLRYSIDWDANWLSVDPASGQSGGESKGHSVSVDAAGLSEGSYPAVISIFDQHASNTPQHIQVTLNVTSPSTDNRISLSCSPGSGKTGTIVSFPVSIAGNISEITVFGLDLTFDTSIFAFHSVSRGSLTGSWTAVDGNETDAGTIKTGGFAGMADPIPISSTGSIVIVKLKVISTASADRLTSVTIKNYIDDIQSMTPSSTSASFTYLK